MLLARSRSQSLQTPDDNTYGMTTANLPTGSSSTQPAARGKTRAALVTKERGAERAPCARSGQLSRTVAEF